MACLVPFEALSVLAYRAAGMGARVLVCDPDPGRDRGAAAANSNGLLRCELDRALQHSASFATPLLVVSCLSAPAATGTWPDQAWRSRLIRLPGVDLRSMAQVRAADAVVIGAVEAARHRLLRSTLRLSGSLPESLADMTPSRLLVCSGRRHALVDLDPTAADCELASAIAGGPS